ncbi:uncharacterized protein prr14 [Lampris incognitus]|uniref:uncharacterized protein prr14 n=1 Tax=Lampris incognitus TaxID=2546036 RepID=UPI0024B5A859|nr:uncharacterized protein prr14 [Lampris incognitus]
MEEGNDGDLLATTSKSSISQGLNSSESEVDPSNIIKDMENSLNPSETNTLVSKGLKRKGGPRKSFAKRNKVVLHMDTVNPSGAIIVSLLRQGNGVPQTGQEDGKGRKNTSSTTKSLKRITNLCLSKADGSVDNLDLETTMTTNLTKGAQGQQLPEVLVQPLNEMLGSSQPASEVQPKSVCRKRVVSQVCIIEPSQGPSKLTNVDKKSHKRKTRKENSALKQGSIVNPTSTVLFTSKLTSTDRNASQLAHIEENWKKEQKAPSRRPKRVHEGTFKPSVLDGTQMTERSADSCQKLVKEGHSQGEKNVSLQSLIVHCGMMTIEDEHKPHPSPCLFEEPILQLDEQKVKNDLSGPSNCIRERPTASLPGKIFLAEAASLAENKGTDNEEDKHKKVESCSHVVGVNASELKHSRRGVKNRPSRARIETRKCKVLLNRVHEPEENQEGEMSIVSGKKVDLASAESCVSKNESFSGHLWRSHSCPEIPSLLHVHYDTPVITLPHSLQRSRVQATHQQQPVPVLPVPHARRSARRARRHTVCSVEVEREIAPLCLRKEVYPSRRTAPYGNITQYASPSASLSPSTSLTALASCFLFSPLAFLSKKLETRGVAAGSSSTCNHISSPSSPSVFTSSASPVASPAAWQQFPGCDVSAATASSTCSVLSQIHLGCEIDTRRQHKEEEEDGEDTSCSSQEFEDVVLTEEKALSDSEIKVVKMNEGRGKVSSIRIRKTLPKPQNNLTPMGLPKPIRLKKKEFSLEEIYTNKNFTKPPESRLETIFEMPLSRRNGSQSLFGQKRVKRLVEFPDVSVARKPKKPLVGAGKAGITSSFGRPRRGGFLNSKDEPSISVQELDSLLCAKLGQLDLWLTSDQKDC